MSRTKLAEATGTNVSTVSRYLNGTRKMPFDKLVVVASLVGKTVEELGLELERARDSSTRK